MVFVASSWQRKHNRGLCRHSTVVVRNLGKIEVLSSSLSDGFGTR